MHVDVELDFLMTPTLTNPKLDLGMTHGNFVAFKGFFRSISTAPQAVRSHLFHICILRVNISATNKTSIDHCLGFEMAHEE